jgi:hypothetical protein
MQAQSSLRFSTQSFSQEETAPVKRRRKKRRVVFMFMVLMRDREIKFSDPNIITKVPIK